VLPFCLCISRRSQFRFNQWLFRFPGGIRLPHISILHQPDNIYAAVVAGAQVDNSFDWDNAKGVLHRHHRRGDRFSQRCPLGLRPLHRIVHVGFAFVSVEN